MSVPATSPNSARRKKLGAFYTPPAMAAKLVEWAVRSPNDHVLDPSFGGLVFLRAAQDHLLRLGATSDDLALQLHGIELDVETHREATQAAGSRLPSDGLLLGDFFSVEPGRQIPKCQAVIGNPPYIRYQDFKRSAEAAHRIAEIAGVRLTRLASSWAPFLIHAAAYVALGGRMAQVLPAELLHAQYAGEVTDFLQRKFGRVTITVFEERVFPGAMEEVVLLFAEDRGADRFGEVQLLSCDTFNDLDLAQVEAASSDRHAPQVPKAAPREKLLAQLLPAESQGLYRAIAESDGVRRLGELAEVDIGAVTGANDFFLLAATEVDGLAPELLRPTVSKAAQIRGARYRCEDHDELVTTGRKALMLVADADTPPALLETARHHLEAGREIGIHTRYKCRTRDPWWAVPLPKIGTPDLLLTYCANKHPRLALNEAQVIQTNTIHGVRVKERRLAARLAASFYNSLTLLSAELVGRSYGGGVLKLEPTEAEAVLIPPLTAGSASQLAAVDELVRKGDVEGVLSLVDHVVLGDGLGLNAAQIGALRSGAARLRARRRVRGKPPRAR